MPLFYLHIHCDGDVILDEEGMDYASLVAAELEAIKAARAMIAADVLEGALRLDQAIQISGGDGRHLSTIRFSDVVQVVTSRMDERRSAANDHGEQFVR
jgi:hypothetical protein